MMAVSVTPLLGRMTEIYNLSLQGGAGSERFQAYVEACKSGIPMHGYNPMTSAPVLDVISALVGIEAEQLVATSATETAEQLGHDADEVMYLTIAAPGMWTDRLATEVEHRLLGKDPASVLWWLDLPFTTAGLTAEAVAQTVRLISYRRNGPPTNLKEAVRQEGAAALLSGVSPRLDRGAAEAYDILSNDSSLSSMVAFLYGDDAANAMGFTPLALADGVGTRHAAAMASAR